jgi:hypothetical protein
MSNEKASSSSSQESSSPFDEVAQFDAHRVQFQDLAGLTLAQFRDLTDDDLSDFFKSVASLATKAQLRGLRRSSHGKCSSSLLCSALLCSALLCSALLLISLLITSL